MSGSGKGGSPKPPDDGWDGIDGAWAEAEGEQSPVPAAGAAADERSRTDQAIPAVTDDMLEAEAVEEFAEEQATVSHLIEDRELPVVPPGERRVAKTIMGVGTPELQALFAARLSEPPKATGRATPMPASVPPLPPAAPARPPTPLVVAPPARPAPLAPPPLAMVATEPLLASDLAPTPDDLLDRPAAAYASTEQLQRLEAVSESTTPTPSGLTPPPAIGSPGGRPPSADASTVPGLPPSMASAGATIEPATVRMKGSSPRVTPTAGTRRSPTGAPKSSSGPSNLVLIILWVVAIASVGVAAFLYLAR